jgi:Helicase associated domain
LEDYRTEHGDCCVTINHSNRQLANWVSNLRKQYNLRVSGKHSTLTEEKIDQLNAIGFVWNRWEYEFDVKIEKSILLEPSLNQS